MRSRKGLIYNIGINDANYPVQINENTGDIFPSGKKKQKVVWRCPFYNRWTGMIERCYSLKWRKKYSTYKGCTVCKSWLTFSNFRKWMITKDWEGKELDKDLLVEGNKIYSPTTCIFIDQKINKFVLEQLKRKGEFLIGCSWSKQHKRFKANCNNTFTKKYEFLGYFDSETEAHLAWKERKHELACQLANSEYVTDPRLARVLRIRYENYTEVEN